MDEVALVDKIDLSHFQGVKKTINSSKGSANPAKPPVLDCTSAPTFFKIMNPWVSHTRLDVEPLEYQGMATDTAWLQGCPWPWSKSNFFGEKMPPAANTNQIHAG